MRVTCLLLLSLALLAWACTAPTTSPRPTVQTTRTPTWVNSSAAQATDKAAPLPTTGTEVVPGHSGRAPTRTPTPAKLANTPKPTLTPLLTYISWPTLAPPITHTPAPGADCPLPDNSVSLTLGPNLENIEMQIRAYLSAGGSLANLRAALTGSRVVLNTGPVMFKALIIYKDVTGDMTPDIVMDLRTIFEGEYAGYTSSTVFIFWCDQGQYKSFADGSPSVFLQTIDQSDEDTQGLRMIQEMNLNGVPEIVISRINNIILGPLSNHFVDFYEAEDVCPFK